MHGQSQQAEPQGHACCNVPGHHRPWYRDPLFWTLATAVAFWCGPMCVPALRPLGEAYWGYVGRIWWAVGLGLLLGGLIDRFIPREYFSKLLASPRKRTIVTATGLGFLASACSHGVIALSMEIYRKGASVPATMAFLLASPWASLPFTLLIVSLFGWKGLLIVALALLVAVVTGVIFQQLQQRGVLAPNPHTLAVDERFSILADLTRRLRGLTWHRNYLEDVRAVGRASLELGRMVLFWVNLGLAMSALLGTYVPSTLFQHYLGPSLLGLGATLVLATVLEVCSEGTAPVAFELYKQTAALGNAFAFLMGGVITDFTEISIVWSNLGRRPALLLLAITLPQVIFLAFLLNRF